MLKRVKRGFENGRKVGGKVKKRALTGNNFHQLQRRRKSFKGKRILRRPQTLGSGVEGEKKGIRVGSSEQKKKKKNSFGVGVEFRQGIMVRLRL